MPFKEDVKLKALLQKWNLQQANISSESDLGRQQLWSKLCPTALPIVVSGLLQFYRTSSPSLKEHILEHQEIFSGLDLFDCVLSEDREICAIIQSCQ